MRRSLQVGVAVLSVGCIAFAVDDKKILGKDDVAFGNALSRAGYSDLAKVVFDAIDRTRGAAGGAGWAKIQLQLDEANKEIDPNKRVALLVKVVDAAEGFAQAHAGTEEGDEALDRLTDLYRAVGESTAAAMEKTTDTTELARLRTEGGQMFDRAITSLQKRIDEVKAKIAKLNPNATEEEVQKLQDERMFASYSLARTYYFHALLLEAGSYAKTTRLKSAIATLEEFELDFADNIVCYEVYIYDGLCHKEMADGHALEGFDSAIGLRDRFEKNSKGVYQFPEEMSSAIAGIISQAVLQKALFLTASGDHAGALAAIREYFDTIPDAVHAQKGLALLVQEAECYAALNDQKGVTAVAKQLIDVDPRGAGGQKGRELLGEASSSSLSAGDTLRLAQSAFADNDLERAISLSQQTLIQIRGTPDAPNVGATTGLVLGTAYQKLERPHEAVVAWETAADRFQQGKDGVECLNRAVLGYLELQRAEKSAYYKNRARALMALLVSRYPTSSYAADSAIFEAQQLDAEGKFAEAAASYEAVPTSSKSYEKALYYAASEHSKVAQQLIKQGRTGEAKAEITKAENLYKKARPALEALAQRTLDSAQQTYLNALAFASRMGIAALCLMEGSDRAGEVLTMFPEPEREFSDAPDKLAAVRAAILKAYLKMGKIDDAAKALDERIKADPNGSNGGDAIQLAQEFDQRGSDLRKKEPTSPEVDRLWRKAANYYFSGIRGQLEGRESPRASELEGIAGRLYTLALHFSGVPEAVDNWVDWSGGRLDEEMFQMAIRAMEGLLQASPSDKTQLDLARANGFLKRWEQAATNYADLFDRQQFVDPSKTFNQGALRAMPQLIFAYREWGICEREVAAASGDASHMARAAAIFENLLNNTTKGSKLWWQSRYYQLKTMYDRGEYEVGNTSISSLEISYPNYDDDQYGLRERFKTLKEDFSKKVFKKQPIVPAEPPTKK